MSAAATRWRWKHGKQVQHLYSILTTGAHVYRGPAGAHVYRGPVFHHLFSTMWKTGVASVFHVSSAI